MSYDRTLVELLLPGVWDETYAYGMRMPTMPDPDMPKGTVDKKKGSALYAHLADVRRAWSRSPGYLTHKQRVALFLRYGCDWTLQEVAYNQGVQKQNADVRITSAVGKVTDYLNGRLALP